MSGDRTMNSADLADALGHEHVPTPALATAAPGHAADQGVRRAGGQPEVEGDEVPHDGADEAGEDHADRQDVLHDDVLGDGAWRRGCRRPGRR